jgi:hypothetical protein
MKPITIWPVRRARMNRSIQKAAMAIGILLFSAAPSVSTEGIWGVQGNGFVAYETLEMVMNRFQNFAGEFGYRFGSKYQIRLSVMEVKLTERHLASTWESAAVDGKGVKGYFRGYELHADRFFYGNWYIGANLGYYADKYEHVTLPVRVKNQTPTVGIGLGYSRANLFGVEHLYLDFSNPFRYYFDQIKKTKLGDATVMPHVVVNNMWFFVGYWF